jgi:DnaJ-class molecular chaperone
MFGNPDSYTQRASSLLGMSGGSGPRNTFSRKALPDTHYYEVLGVSYEASQDEITRAYHEARRRHHPDAPGGSQAMFVEVQEAYKVLSNETSRRAYDTYGAAGASLASASRDQPGSATSEGGGASDVPSWGSFDRRSGGGTKTRSRFDPFSGVSMDDAWNMQETSLENLYGVKTMFDYGTAPTAKAGGDKTIASSGQPKVCDRMTIASSGQKLPADAPMPQPKTPNPDYVRKVQQPLITPSAFAGLGFQPKTSRELVATVKTTLSELRFHQEREASFRVPQAETSSPTSGSIVALTCPNCSGKGIAYEYEGPCNACNGTGSEGERASVAFQLTSNGVCRWCEGSGLHAVSKKTCDTCTGSGKIPGPKPTAPSASSETSGKLRSIKVRVRTAARDGEVVGEVELGGGWIGRVTVSEQKHPWLRRDREEGQHLWVVSKRHVEGKGWEIPYMDESGRDAFWGCLPGKLAKCWKPGDVVKVEGNGLIPGKSHLYVVLRPAKEGTHKPIIPGEASSTNRPVPPPVSLQTLNREECQRYDVPTVGDCPTQRHQIEIDLDLP